MNGNGSSPKPLLDGHTRVFDRLTSTGVFWSWMEKYLSSKVVARTGGNEARQARHSDLSAVTVTDLIDTSAS